MKSGGEKENGGLAQEENICFLFISNNLPKDKHHRREGRKKKKTQKKKYAGVKRDRSPGFFLL